MIVVAAAAAVAVGWVERMMLILLIDFCYWVDWVFDAERCFLWVRKIFLMRVLNAKNGHGTFMKTVGNVKSQLRDKHDQQSETFAKLRLPSSF